MTIVKNKHIPIPNPAIADSLRRKLRLNDDRKAREDRRIAENIRKKTTDRWWRLNNLYYIIDDSSNKIIFKPEERPVQRYLYENAHSRMIILKSRQHGVTTFFCIWYLDICLTCPNIRAGIIADNQEDAKRFLRTKIKYAYNNIRDPRIKTLVPVVRDNETSLVFANGSSIEVGTTLVSTTLNLLHISEYGLVSINEPQKAKDIKAGAINATLGENTLITIESTSRGAEGEFYNIYKTAKHQEDTGEYFTRLDFKPYFFGWYQKPECVLRNRSIIIDDEHSKYFEELEQKHNISLTLPQKNWYAKTYAVQQDLMLQEFPSTWEEAFQHSVVGAYYQRQMYKLRKDQRHLNTVYDPNLYVNVSFDIGISDNMALTFYQLVGDWIVVIDYYENSDEDLSHYVDVIKSKPYKYNKIFMPHDASKRDIITGKSLHERAKAEFNLTTTLIPQSKDVVQDINYVRSQFHRIKIDQQKCSVLIKHLDNYKKKYNSRIGMFSGKPEHNEASNGADSFRYMIFSLEYLEDRPIKKFNIPRRPPGTF